jgi:hypothetical protein
MKIEFNMVDLVTALEVVSIVAPRAVTANGGSGFLFVVKDKTCFLYSRDDYCLSRSSFPLISSEADGSFVYPAEYVSALKILAKSPSAENCTMEATEADERFTVKYRAGGAKAERSSFSPQLLLTCDDDLAAATHGQEFSAGILREAIAQAKPFLGEAGDSKVEENYKGLQILDATRSEYVKGDGVLYVSDGVRACYFNAEAFKGKHLEIHGAHLGRFTSFLAKAGDKVTILRGVGYTFAVDGKGNVFGWPKHAKVHGKFGYYPLKSDEFVLRMPKSRILNSLQHARSELGAVEDKIKLSFDPERRELGFGITASMTKVDGIPCGVDIKHAANANPWAFNVNIDHLLDLISYVKGNEVELRARIIPPSEDRRNEFAMFRTLDEFLMDAAGKVTVEPEGATKCTVTRFMPSKG